MSKDKKLPLYAQTIVGKMAQALWEGKIDQGDYDIAIQTIITSLKK